MDKRTFAQIAAQIACEAVINADPGTYTFDAIVAVKENGITHGVSDFYLNMIPA